MTQKRPPRQTPPLPANQSYLDANKKALKEVEKKLAAKKQAAKGPKKW